MTNKEIIKKYFNKHFKSQYFTKDDLEFKDLVKMLNKKDKQVKNNDTLPIVINCSNCNSTDIIKEHIFRCKECNCFHDNSGAQL